MRGVTESEREIVMEAYSGVMRGPQERNQRESVKTAALSRIGAQHYTQTLTESHGGTR